MLKVMMLFVVLSPEGTVVTTAEKDVSLTMSYQECVVSAPSVADILEQYYASIKYQRVDVKAECIEE